MACPCCGPPPPPPLGCCCVDGQIVFATQQDCEDCGFTSTCYEYAFVEEGQACPEGFEADGPDSCSRVTTVASCSECAGSCDTQQTGNCGTFYPNATMPGCATAVKSYLEAVYTNVATLSCAGQSIYHGPNGKVWGLGNMGFRNATGAEPVPGTWWGDIFYSLPVVDPNTVFDVIGLWENPGECEAYLENQIPNDPFLYALQSSGSPCCCPTYWCRTTCVDTNNPLP